MPVLTIPRSDVTTEEVAAALREGLGPGYDVVPGMGMGRAPFGRLRSGQPDAIVVRKGSGGRGRTLVVVVRQASRTQILVGSGALTAGGVFLNALPITRRVHRALLDAPAPLRAA